MAREGIDDLTLLAQKAAAGSVRFGLPEGRDADAARGRPRAARSAPASSAIDRRRVERERLVKRHGDPKQRPWIYLIVATGDIYEDIPQAQAAARAGRRRDRGDPLDRTVAAGLRARGRHPGGLRRHLRDPGELPADAGRAGRVQRGSWAATCG